MLLVGCVAQTVPPADENKGRPGPEAVEYEFLVTYPFEHQVLYPWEDDFWSESEPTHYRTEVRCGVTDRDSFDADNLTDPVIAPSDHFFRIKLPREPSQLSCDNHELEALGGGSAECVSVNASERTATFRMSGRLAPRDGKSFVSDDLYAGCKLRRSVSVIEDLAVHATGVFDAGARVDQGRATGELIVGSSEGRMSVEVNLVDTTERPDYFDCSLSLVDSWWQELGAAIYSGFVSKHFRLERVERTSSYQATLDVAFHRRFPTHNLTCTPQWSFPAMTTGVGVSKSVTFEPKELVEVRWDIEGGLGLHAEAELDIQVSPAVGTRSPPDYFSCSLALGESYLDQASYAVSTGYVPTWFKLYASSDYQMNMSVAFPRAYPEHHLYCEPVWEIAWWWPTITYVSRTVSFEDGKRLEVRLTW